MVGCVTDSLCAGKEEKMCFETRHVDRTLDWLVVPETGITEITERASIQYPQHVLRARRNACGPFSKKYDFALVAWWDMVERPCQVGSSTVTMFDAQLSITSMLLRKTEVALAKALKAKCRANRDSAWARSVSFFH